MTMAATGWLSRPPTVPYSTGPSMWNLLANPGTFDWLRNGRLWTPLAGYAPHAALGCVAAGGWRPGLPSQLGSVVAVATPLLAGEI